MINVEFIEEIIFRGFLFKMMEKDNVKRAIIVNEITFGIGHIVNLLNGEELIPTLMQICYAIYKNNLKCNSYNSKCKNCTLNCFYIKKVV